ncbi:lytic transglycosylase domain-containing protein [Jannaschia aquimarina]|uniref:Slt_1 protein n=1 Tax=Jannaschia aquimarina TaxID=935700 RepID=A0A0D1EJJ2_9RHOB|nr:lytic transglycosylase domain-containing protein [Jannaschia aquimarina]KIT17754.1 Soluble lytic murein transglycosylase precursor [Jannaschia aquimarina]SNS96226.1 soluble lytic murein transglycosylase [Jannaschia aquimarina]
MTPFRRLALAATTALAVSLTLAPASRADGEFTLGLSHLRDGRPDAARAAMTRVDEDVLRDVLLWHLLRDRAGSFAEMVDFLDRNADWPGLDLMRIRAEQVMPVALPPSEVIAFFDGREPNTGNGALRLAIALRAAGRTDEAEAIAIDSWLTRPMPPAAHAGFIEVFGEVLEPFHPARLDAMIWSGDLKSAGRTLPLVEGPERALAEARIALREGKPGVDALIAAVPETLRSHAGLAYERFRWRLDKGRIRGEDGALELLFAYDTDADSLVSPEAWAPHRYRLARGLKQDGHPRDGYRVAANHGLPEGHRDSGQIEWLAGYIALRHLDDPSLAAEHFRRFDAAVASPISKGRAGYWLGRALEEAGDAEGAEAAYAAGAEYQTSFYGQLAAERGGIAPDPLLAGDERFPPLAETSLQDSTVLEAARELAELGERDLAERFATHLADVLPREEIGTLIDEVLSWDEPHVALKIAKRAALRGMELHRGYYPVTPLAALESPVAPELSLSIARRESEFDPIVVSHAGARGLMQLMPGTAREMAGLIGLNYEKWRLTDDPLYNARLGTAYLGELEAEFGPSPVLVPAAYNAGPSRARRWSARLGDPSDPSVDIVDWIEDVPFSETRNYIMRVSESLLPYRAQLAGLPEAVSLTEWLRNGYGEFAPGPVMATRSGEDG